MRRFVYRNQTYSFFCKYFVDHQLFIMMYFCEKLSSPKKYQGYSFAITVFWVLIVLFLRENNMVSSCMGVCSGQFLNWLSSSWSFSAVGSEANVRWRKKYLKKDLLWLECFFYGKVAKIKAVVNIVLFNMARRKDIVEPKM